MFPFADTDAIRFYERCGYEPIEEFVETTDIDPVASRPGAVKLDPGSAQDLDRVHAYARMRAPVSDRFSVMNANLVMFHVLHGLRD